MNDGHIREIYRQSLEINCATFAAGEYGIAYQVLLVALQCGQRLRDLSFLSEVQRLAEKQSRYLDDHFPQCEYSNKAALQRGNLGLFQTAAHQARTMVRTMRQPKRWWLDLVRLKSCPEVALIHRGNHRQTTKAMTIAHWVTTTIHQAATRYRRFTIPPLAAE